MVKEGPRAAPRVKMLAWPRCALETLRGKAGAGAGGREGVSGHRLSFSLPSSPPQMLGGGLDDLRLPVFLKLIIKKKRKLKKKK